MVTYPMSGADQVAIVKTKGNIGPVMWPCKKQLIKNNSKKKKTHALPQRYLQCGPKAPYKPKNSVTDPYSHTNLHTSREEKVKPETV